MQEDLDLWFEREILVHERGLRWFISRFMRRWEVADFEVIDILQDVYIRVWKDVACQHGSYRSTKAYLYRVAKNLLIDWARRRGVLRIDNSDDMELLDKLIDEVTPERSVSDLEQLNRLKKCFDKLTDRRREAVWLRRVEGLSQKDTAARMRITEGALEQTFRHAMIQLTNCYGSDGSEAESAPSHRTTELGTQHGK